MKRIYEVIIEQKDGRYHAVVPRLLGVSAEAATREAVLEQVRQAAINFLARVELTTIEVDVPEGKSESQV